MLLIPVEKPDWCEAEGNDVVLHTGTRSPMLRKAAVEALLRQSF
ncbi:hypothetical protein [Corallococcus exiguus]|nr:hypothetical protein [Corallococcus exiguus]